MLLFPGESVFVDLIAYVHLLFVAIGFGLAIRLDFLFFQKRWSNVSKVMLADTLQSHHMIMFAMVGLWATGLALIYVRTGFVLAEFSAKIFMKIFIVSLLSINAVAISTFVMPVMERFQDRPLLALPIKYKLPMAVCAATSAFCWFSSLALGSMAFLKTQSWDNLASGFSALYIGGLLIAVTVALLVHVPDLEDQAEKA
jgi:hypothetical protein